MLVTSALYCSAPFAVAEQDKDGIYINEVCTQNKKSFTDSLGRASDWIELYNGGNEDIDLSGFGLTDSADTPMKFVFPSGTVIKAGKYLIIAADKNGEGMTELNTGFGLSKSGETLYLFSPDGTELKKLEIPSLAEDSTYGRSADGSYAVMSPTPAAENLSAPAEPVFSLESGFYSVDDVKELTISSGYTVYYTLDGSDPTVSETAKVYSGAIPMYDRSADANVYSMYQQEDDSPYSITLGHPYEANPNKMDKATVVRAAAKSEDGSFSNVTSKTYFVMDEEKLEYYSKIPVVSLVTDPDNLFDKDKGIYVTGQQYMDWSANNTDTEITANFLSSGKAWEREADITYFDNGSLGFTQKMGMRIRGASTRTSPAKSFNMYARSEYGDSKLDYKIIDVITSVFDGKKDRRYDSFGLRAVAWVDRLRERVVNFSLRDMPALATYDSDRCMLFIDGEFWGMYEITEKASDYYIQSNYGVPAENVSIIKNGELEEGPDDEPLNLQRLGEFCRDNDLSVDENYEYVASQVDLESIIDCYCTGLYIGTWDWPNYNYLMWRYKGDAIDGNPYSDGKWRFGSFDFDYSLGLTYDEDIDESELYKHDSFKKMDGVKDAIPTVIFSRLLDNPEFRQQFADRFYSYAYSVFEPSKMTAELDKEEMEYMDYMTMTAWRWNDYDPSELDSFLEEQKKYFHNEMDVMRSFFEKRPEYAVENMQNYLGISNDAATVTVTVKGSGGIAVDSVDAELSGNVWTGSYERGREVTLTAKPAKGYVFAGWTGAAESASPTITVSADKAASLVCSFAEDYKPGDIDMDGKIKAADLVLMSKYLHGKEQFSRMQFMIADINEDGNADIFDLVLLRKELLK